MAEGPSSGGPLASAASSDERWSLLLPHRGDLLRFARTMGAGQDAEDVVHEALMAAARYSDLDEQRVWALLANIIAKRITDRYRRAARVQMLVRHRALLQRPRSFEHDVIDRAEAVWVANQLVRILPQEIMDVLWRHHVGGATWAEQQGRDGLMVWYEKAILVAVVALTSAAIVNIFWQLGPDLPYGLWGTVLGILGVVLILERRKREARRDR